MNSVVNKRPVQSLYRTLSRRVRSLEASSTNYSAVLTSWHDIFAKNSSLATFCSAEVDRMPVSDVVELFKTNSVLSGALRYAFRLPGDSKQIEERTQTAFELVRHFAEVEKLDQRIEVENLENEWLKVIFYNNLFSGLVLLEACRKGVSFTSHMQTVKKLLLLAAAPILDEFQGNKQADIEAFCSFVFSATAKPGLQIQMLETVLDDPKWVGPSLALTDRKIKNPMVLGALLPELAKHAGLRNVKIVNLQQLQTKKGTIKFNFQYLVDDAWFVDVDVDSEKCGTAVVPHLEPEVVAQMTEADIWKQTDFSPRKMLMSYVNLQTVREYALAQPSDEELLKGAPPASVPEEAAFWLKILGVVGRATARFSAEERAEEQQGPDKEDL